MAKDRDGLHKRSGVWYYRYRGSDGKSHERSTRTSKYEDARDIYHQHRADQRAGVAPLERAGWTWKQALDAWLMQRELDGWAPNTLRLDRERKKAIEKQLGRYRLRETSSHVLLTYKKARRQEVGPRTFNMERRIIRAILKTAKLWHMVEDDFTPIRHHSKRGRALEPEEFARLEAKAESHVRWEPIWNTALLASNTGLRRGEMLHLHLGDLDLEHHGLKIRRAATKTDAGERWIPLNEEALAAVKYLLGRAQALGATHKIHYLFPACLGRRGGTGYDPEQPQKSLRSAWLNLTKAAGLEGLRMHDLRHTFRSDLADADVDTETAMELMGHKSEEMNRVYRHMRSSARARREQAKRDAVAKLGERKRAHAEKGAVPFRKRSKRQVYGGGVCTVEAA